MPGGRTFWPGRFVAATSIEAGIAEPHGHDYNAGLVVYNASLVVKYIPVQGQPGAQHIVAAVVPGNAGFLHPRAWCLTDNQQFRGGGRAYHWAR